MKKITLLLLGFGLMHSGISMAQKETVYVVNGETGKELSKRSSRNIVEHSHVVKMDLLNQLNGELRFSYERVVGDDISIEFTAGPTIGGLYNSRFLNSSGNFTGKVGASAEFAFKYYPNSSMPALNRFYVSPSIGIKHFRGEYAAPNNVSNETFDGYNQRLYYCLNFGLQQWIGKKLSIDYFAGVGLGVRNEVFGQFLETYDQNTGTFSSTWDKRTTRRNVVQVNVGIKLGFGWSNLKGL